jgi:ribosomal protein L22
MSSKKLSEIATEIDRQPDKRQITWLDRMTTEQRNELLQFRRDYQAGKFGSHTPRSLYEEILPLNESGIEISISYSHFRRWIKGKR